MKKFIQVFILLSFLSPSFAQIQKLEDLDLSTIINKRFSKVVIGENNLIPGNFAAYDIKDSRLSLNASHSLKKKDKFLGIITFNVNAGVTEGFSALVSENHINPTVGGELKFHFLDPLQAPKVRYLKSSLTDLQESLDAITRNKSHKIAKYQQEKELLTKTHDNLTLKLADVKIKLTATPDDAALKESKAKIELDIAEADYKLSSEYWKDIQRIADDAEAECTDLSNKAKANIELSGYTMGWFSIRYRVLNRNFYRFDSTQVFASQLPTQDYTLHEMGIEYNHYRHSRWEFDSFFYSLGMAYSIADNFNKLEKRDVTDSYNYGSIPSTPSTRTSQKKYTAYKGDYKTGIQQMRFYLDLYYFVLPNHSGAVHIYPEVVYRFTESNLSNIGLGLLFPFKNKNDKDGKSLVNVEFYALFRDLYRAENTGKLPFYQRNEIGLRVAFPINFEIKENK